MDKQEKCSITQKDRIVIHKDDKEKRIYSEELDFYISCGWSKGISLKHKENLSEYRKGREPWNKNTKGVMKPNQTSFKKGHTLWCKGKKRGPLSQETKQKLSTIRKGKKKSIKWRKKLSESHKGISNKYKGIHRPQWVKDKISQAKLGHEVTEETKQKISKTKKGKKISLEKLEIKLSKEYITKKLNNSFNSSSAETKFYEELLKENKNKTIYKQYKDERYPFYCDFYILEDDLFIELNAHWTHGGRPYDSQDIECQKQLSIWQEKAKTSQFYQNAIITWTIRDVEKQECAKKNNLNYKVIY